MSQHYYTNFT